MIMQYRKDKNGNEISVLGYGCMRFTKEGGHADIDKAEKEVMAAIDAGVNYLDTAYVYAGNEAAVGEILARNHCRERIYLATKLPHYLIKSVEGAQKMFEEELRRLQTDYIDYYLMHMLTDLPTWEKLKKLGMEDWIREKKASGEIRNIGFSYHGRSDMFMQLIDAYDWDFCQIQYNYMDEHSQAGVEGLHHIRADITDETQVRAAVQQVMDAEGQIDVVVNNAGFGISGAVEFTDTADAQRLFNADFFGMVRVNRAVIAHMRAAGRGRIVNLSSVAGRCPSRSRRTTPRPRRRSTPIPWPWPMKCAPSASPSAPSSREISPRASPPPGRSPRPATGSTAAASAGPWPGWSGTRKPAWRRKPQAPFSAGWPWAAAAVPCTPSAGFTAPPSCS